MPKVKEYKIDTETLKGSVADTVTAEEFKKFRASLFFYPGYREYPAQLEWTPEFPFASSGYFDTIGDEAIYRSNHRVISDDFKEALGENNGYEIGTSTISFDLNATHAIARAVSWQQTLEDYPIADEDDYSELQTELQVEAYNDYGRKELIEKLQEYPELEWLFDEDSPETGGIDPEINDIVEPYLYRIADYAVSYSGEMYFSDSSLRSALEDIGGLYGWPRPEMAALVDAFSYMLRHEQAERDQAIFEQTQPPLINVERS